MPRLIGAASRVDPLIYVVTSSSTDVVLRDSLNSIWDGVTPVDFFVYIQAGVIIGGTSLSVPALDIGDISNARTMRIFNAGQVWGKSGSGGAAGTAQPSSQIGGGGSAGGDGGLALRATTMPTSGKILLFNSGIIGGGGGGGGGGSAVYYQVDVGGEILTAYADGGGGNVGQGYPNTGGPAAGASGGTATDSNGAMTSTLNVNGGDGGGGGDAGAVGTGGSVGTANVVGVSGTVLVNSIGGAGAFGAAGAAIDGLTYMTISNTGTIYGTQS